MNIKNYVKHLVYNYRSSGTIYDSESVIKSVILDRNFFKKLPKKVRILILIRQGLQIWLPLLILSFLLYPIYLYTRDYEILSLSVKLILSSLVLLSLSIASSFMGPSYGDVIMDQFKKEWKAHFGFKYRDFDHLVLTFIDKGDKMLESGRLIKRLEGKTEAEQKAYVQKLLRKINLNG